MRFVQFFPHGIHVRVSRLGNILHILAHLFEFWFPHHGDVGTHILNVLALLQAASAVGIKTLTQLLSNGDITRDQFDSFVNDQMVFLSNPSQIRKHLAETKKPFFGPPEIGIPLIYKLLMDAYPFIQVSLLTI